ncbi:MAG: hypothetical protein QHJ73_01815 [Armatimonadota bacterium]|nr:hypothetical protein [Armatimonadota bacterium]
MEEVAPERGAGYRVAPGWRAATLGVAAAVVAVCLSLRRQAHRTAVLARSTVALRHACLSFPLPVPLRAWRVHRFRHGESGTQTLSFRLPAGTGPEWVHAYYREYLRGQGFTPLPSEGNASTREVCYLHADGLRRVWVAVIAPPRGAAYHTVIVRVAPAMPLS